MYIVFNINGINTYVLEEDFTDYQLSSQQMNVKDGKQEIVNIYNIILNNIPTWQIPLNKDTVDILEEIKNKRKNDLTKNK